MATIAPHSQNHQPLLLEGRGKGNTNKLHPYQFLKKNFPDVLHKILLHLTPYATPSGKGGWESKFSLFQSLK